MTGELLLDEGGMIVENPIGGVYGIYGMVGVVEKGYGDVKFIAKSNGGHASAPGKNTALVRLGKFMCDVEKKNPFEAQFTPVVQEMFTRMAPNMNFGMKLIFFILFTSFIFIFYTRSDNFNLYLISFQDIIALEEKVKFLHF